MKTMARIFLLGLSFALVSCGGKESSSSESQAFGVDAHSARTLSGYFNPNNTYSPIEVGGVVYQLGPMSNHQAIGQAMQQLQGSGIQPVNIDGMMKYQAHITGYLHDPNQGVQNQYLGQPQQPVQQNVLTLTGIQFY